MATEVEYALMAGRVYQSTRETINWLPDLYALGWAEFLPQQYSSGFEAVSFQNGNEIVISYAGTGAAVDWWANAGGFTGVTTAEDEERGRESFFCRGAPNNDTRPLVFPLDDRNGCTLGPGGEPPAHRPPAENGGSVACPHSFFLFPPYFWLVCA